MKILRAKKNVYCPHTGRLLVKMGDCITECSSGATFRLPGYAPVDRYTLTGTHADLLGMFDLASERIPPMIVTLPDSGACCTRYIHANPVHGECDCDLIITGVDTNDPAICMTVNAERCDLMISFLTELATTLRGESNG